MFHNTDISWPPRRWPKLRLARPVITSRLGETFDLPSEDHQHNVDFIMTALTMMLDEVDAATND